MHQEGQRTMEPTVLRVPQARVVPVLSYAKTPVTEVYIPEGAEVLGSKCFSRCHELRLLHLPRTLRYIEMKAFFDCPLEQIRFAGSAADWQQIEISPIGNEALIRARKHFDITGPAPEKLVRADRSPQLIARIRELMASGGDGRLHIVVPELTIPGGYQKCGDLTLIVFPQGSTMIIDAGLDRYFLKVRAFLDAVNLTKLDYLVFSHACSDHVSGGPLLIDYLWSRGGTVGHLWWTGQQFGRFMPQILSMLQERGTQIDTAVCEGQRFEIDGVQIDILGPTKEELMGDANDGLIRNGQSMIMRFAHGAARYLTSGDLYAEHEEIVAARCGNGLCADVCKANHHGCFTSNSDLWLDTVRPRLVFSTSNDNGCVRLEEETARRGAAYASTGCNGLLLISLSADGTLSLQKQFDSMQCIQRIN